MKYKLLGFTVWKGARWYAKRRYGAVGRKLFAGGVLAALIAGTAAAQRRASNGH